MVNGRHVRFTRQAPHFGAFMELMVGAGSKLFKKNKMPAPAKAILLRLRSRAALSRIVSGHLKARKINYTMLLAPLWKRYRAKGENGGNVGIACWLANAASGIPSITTMVAHSKSSEIVPNGLEPLNSNLKPGLWPNGKRKIDCTEIQILNKFLNNNVDQGMTGDLKLFTELFPCSSCQQVIKDFLQTRPKVSIDLYVELGSLRRSNKSAAIHMLQTTPRLTISSLLQNTR